MVSSSPQVYRIRVRGHLTPDWADWFDGMTITPLDNGDTLLMGVVTDQSALHSLISKIRDLDLPLLAVERMESDSP